jgi:hypothetical protein
MEMNQNMLKVIHDNIINIYRVKVIQDIKLHYVSIMELLKDVVMEINVNLLMATQN